MHNHFWVGLGAIPGPNCQIVVVSFSQDDEIAARRNMNENARKHFADEMPRAVIEMFELSRGKIVRTRLQLKSYFRKIGIPEHLVEKRLEEFRIKLQKALGNPDMV